MKAKKLIPIDGDKLMADNERKCGHPTCDCVIRGDEKYCSEYCENAEKSGVAEIGCGCEHSPCR